jgi:hypothetical protein
MGNSSFIIILIFSLFKLCIEKNEYLINNSTLEIILNQSLWIPQQIDNNYFKHISLYDAKKYLGLISFSNLSGINKKMPPNISSVVKFFIFARKFYDLRKINKLCYDYIENQLNCAVSPAFVMAHMLSDKFCINKNKIKPYKISTQSLISCDNLSNGCKGMRTENIIYTLIKKGVTYEYCHYLKLFGNFKTKCGDLCDDGYTQAQYIQIPSNKIWRVTDTNKIKLEIFEKGSVYAEMEVYQDFFYYQSGIYFNTVTNFIGYHAVRVFKYIFI